MSIMQLVGHTPEFPHYYVIGWSVINFIMKTLMIAIPIIIILLLVKINGRLAKLEEQVREIKEQVLH